MAQEAALTSPKISIIVPVYKVEPYIHRCLDSIAAQTFADWECILIDDGSPDNSGAICDEYAAKDNRFKVIHQPNKGVSAARNAGLDTARGEWIGFVDSDDWIEPNMYESMYSCAVHEDVDIVICGFVGKGQEHRKLLTSFKAKKVLFSLRRSFGGYIVLRLIKKECLGDIRFDENTSYMEDTIFSYEIFGAAKRILWTNTPLYNYFSNPQGVTKQVGLSRQAKSWLLSISKIYNNEQNFILKHQLKALRIHFLWSKALQYVANKISDCKEYMTIQNELRKNFFFVIFSPSFTIKRKTIILVFSLISGKVLEENKLLNSFLLRRKLQK